MMSTRRTTLQRGLAVTVCAALSGSGTIAQQIKISDPTSVLLIVNRDSNELAFMDLESRELVGSVFLGNNVNPHMGMFTPDGRYAVTGGTRANKAYIIDVATLELVKEIPVGFAPEHMGISPDSRYYYQGNPDDDSVSVIDMVSLTEVRRIRGFAEPLNVTFLPDGSKAYVANYGAHWIGVIDVTRHELLKKIHVGHVSAVARLDPDRYLGEIKAVSNASISNDGRYLYAADGDLGIVTVIDTREDRVVKTIPVGPDPWRAFMSHDGKYAVTVNNGDETVSFIDTAQNEVVATFEAGPDMVGVNFAAGQAFAISSTSGFVYAYDLGGLSPAGRIKVGSNVQIETATTDIAEQKLYLGNSTDHTIVIIDGATHQIETVGDIGLYPWGTHIFDSKDNYCH